MPPVTMEWRCQGLLRGLSGHLLCPLWEHRSKYYIFVVTENSFPFPGVAFPWPHFYLFVYFCLLAQDCPASTHWSSGAYEENSVTHLQPFWGKKGGNPFPSARYVLGLNLCPLRYIHEVCRHWGIWGFQKGGFFVILLAVNEGWAAGISPRSGASRTLPSHLPFLSSILPAILDYLLATLDL